MSTEFNSLKSERNKTVNVTRFNGGSKRGMCVQLTQQRDSTDGRDCKDMFHTVQMTAEQVRQLRNRLNELAADSPDLFGE